MKCDWESEKCLRATHQVALSAQEAHEEAQAKVRVAHAEMLPAPRLQKLHQCYSIYSYTCDPGTRASEKPALVFAAPGRLLQTRQDGRLWSEEAYVGRQWEGCRIFLLRQGHPGNRQIDLEVFVVSIQIID